MDDTTDCDFPVIELENTLADLYKANGQKVIIVPPMVANGYKYVYHTEAGERTSSSLSSDQVKLQALAPQHMAFSTGDLPILMFGTDVLSLAMTEYPQTMSVRSAAERTIEALHPDQRPDLVFNAEGPECLSQSDVKHPLAICSPNDALESFLTLIDPESTYELLTKEALASSAIPTPASKSIEITLPPSGKFDATSLSMEISRIAGIVLAHPLPFVLKHNQSFSGMGVYIIRTEGERQRIVEEILPLDLGNHLPKLNLTNAHLKPCSLVTTDLVANIKSNCSLTFFVHQNGHSSFNCCGRQHVDGVHYSGTTVNYAHQNHHEQRMTAIMHAIASFVQKKGYYGPIGADVLEDQDGKLWVVDLNVRWTSSWVLGTLRRHFYLERGFVLARLIYSTFNTGWTRDLFEIKTEEEMRQGRIVIVAWFEAQERDDVRSFAHCVCAAEDEETLGSTVKMVMALCQQ